MPVTVTIWVRERPPHELPASPCWEQLVVVEPVHGVPQAHQLPLSLASSSWLNAIREPTRRLDTLPEQPFGLLGLPQTLPLGALPNVTEVDPGEAPLVTCKTLVE